MKIRTTDILRLAVILIGLFVLGLCVFELPARIMSDHTGLYRPLLFGLYVSAIPFFIALYQALKLLGHIDHNKAFSDFSVNTLKNIKYCAIAIAAMFAAGLPYSYVVADKDDAPGVLAIALVIVFASSVIAVFAAVLQKLLKDALDIKSENDLTV